MRKVLNQPYRRVPISWVPIKPLEGYKGALKWCRLSWQDLQSSLKCQCSKKRPTTKENRASLWFKLEKCLWSIGILHLKLIHAAWLSVLSLCQIGAGSCCLQSRYAFTCSVFQRRRSLLSKAAPVLSSVEGSMILIMRGWSLFMSLITHCCLKLAGPDFGKLIKRENPTPEHLSPKGFAIQLTSVNPWYLRYLT